MRVRVRVYAACVGLVLLGQLHELDEPVVVVVEDSSVTMDLPLLLLGCSIGMPLRGDDGDDLVQRPARAKVCCRPILPVCQVEARGVVSVRLLLPRVRVRARVRVGVGAGALVRPGVVVMQ